MAQRVTAGALAVARSIKATDAPVIVKMEGIVRGAEGILSLAQGVTHWGPPQEALEAARESVTSQMASSYGAGEGDADLVKALQRKLAVENGLEGCEVMVTAGANQAFANIVLALCDSGDDVILFRPYYFNHLMALQMTGCGISFCPRDTATFVPDMDWLEANLPGKKMLVLVNPCNPTGTVTPREDLQRIRAMCAKHGVWLVVDNTYEYFVYDGATHASVGGDHVLNVFSFSKAYGLMGWRMGYIAWQNATLTPELMKVQDTVVICPTRLSQCAAKGALAAGREWCQDRIKTLSVNREILFDAIRAYDPKALMGPHNGAIYAMVKLPCNDDERVAEWLARAHKVAVIPGSACGLPGHVRVAYANLSEDKCREAAERLRSGLCQLRDHGRSVFTESHQHQ